MSSLFLERLQIIGANIAMASSEYEKKWKMNLKLDIQLVKNHIRCEKYR